MAERGFAPAALADWRALALGVLRRAGVAGEDTPIEAVDDLLAVTTYDGIRVAPLYTAADPMPTTGLPGWAPFTRGGRDPTRDNTRDNTVATGWDVRQRHADPDPRVTREAILADLENGVTSVWLELGADRLDATCLPEVLDGVYLGLAGVVLDAGAQTEAAAATFLALVARRGVSAEVAGNLGADPLGWLARTGAPADLRVATALARQCAADLPRLRAVTVDATAYHDAGGSDAEELGCALATGVAYLRALTDGGLNVDTALGQLEFRYAATADQFLTIAKLRAARRLWARVAQVCGASIATKTAATRTAAQRQHAVTSSAMMTARDPWVNMLRTTLACFGAGVGGADAVTVQPFDASLGLPDGFARRIARNTQSLLLEESNVARVIDPAGGSWYVERLTEDLARTAWLWFTEIERVGGMAAALDTGLVADRLAATWARRSDNLAHRRDPITGVSEFPHLDERPPRQTQATRRTQAAPPPSGGLPRHRYAQAFEALRDRADAHAAATGTRPTVFLATLGPAAAYTAPATFAANLFAAGGIATVRSETTVRADTTVRAETTVRGEPGGPIELAAAFARSATMVACLCSSDKMYADAAGPVASALAGAGAARVWLAGTPGDYDGVDSYLYSGCDAVDVIETTLRDLGVSE